LTTREDTRIVERLREQSASQRRRGHIPLWHESEGEWRGRRRKEVSARVYERDTKIVMIRNKMYNVYRDIHRMLS
jgi:hypothetical protein